MVVSLLATRYLKSALFKTSTRIALITAFLGISIATGSMILIVGIMRGFETATITSLQAIHADIIIKAPTDGLNIGSIRHTLTTQFPHITATSPVITQQGLLSTKTASGGVVIHVIDPETQFKVTNLARRFLDTKNSSFSDLFDKHGIVIGYRLAQQLHIKKEDVVTVLIPVQDESTTKTQVVEHTMRVTGCINTGIEEYDTMLVLCSFSTWHTLFPEALATYLYCKTDSSDIPALLQELKNCFTSLIIYDWKSLYPALVSALNLEKYAFILIIALIICMATIGIISLISILITTKYADIAILQMLGLTISKIRRIFLIIGLFISCVSALVGIIGACTLALCFTYIFPISLPDAYYVHYLPIQIDSITIFLVFFMCIIISLAGAWYAVRMVKDLTPLMLLKIEK